MIEDQKVCLGQSGEGEEFRETHRSLERSWLLFQVKQEAWQLLSCGVDMKFDSTIL
jgi:hypothetical protein